MTSGSCGFAASDLRLWATSGSLAAAVSLGTSELFAGLSSQVASPIVSVGDAVIDYAPGAVERWAIESLGTRDKPALVLGIIVISLMIGAAVGVGSRRRRPLALIVFAIFGAVGVVATSRSDQSSHLLGALNSLGAAGAGWVSFNSLVKGLSATGGSGTSLPVEASPVDERRSFLRKAFVALTLALAAPATGFAFRRREAGETESDRRQVAEQISSTESPSINAEADQPDGDTQPDAPSPSSAPTPDSDDSFDHVEGVAKLVTDNSEFYRIDTALAVPQINVDQWSLRVFGMVDTELEFSFDDLIKMDWVEEYVTLSCVSNEVGGGLVGNALWRGVPLKQLLSLAGTQPHASQIVGRSVDRWTGGFPAEILDDPSRVALVAYAMNGEPLPVRHGFPARLVIAGLYGYVSATKWLKEIELTTWEGFDGYWIPRGWSKHGPVKTQSRIDVPKSRSVLSAGPQAVGGVAWAPDRGVDKVEVQIAPDNDTDTATAAWRVARLSTDLSSNAWRQWLIDWHATPGDYTIRVRSTDGDSHTQTEQRSSPAPNGATGWHTIEVSVV